MLGDEPDDGIIDGRVFMRELIAEINDSPSMRDLSEDLRRYARKGGHRLADDDELALNRGAHEPVRCDC